MAVQERRDRIRFLLDHYSDVLAGLRDGPVGGGEHVPLMCRAWNSAGYRELERLLPLMRREAPAGYRATVAVFVYPSWRRRAWCPRCRLVAAPEAIGQLHTHGRKTVVLVARMVRVPLFPVADGQVDVAIGWLAEHRRGEVFVPEELRPLVAA